MVRHISRWRFLSELGFKEDKQASQLDLGSLAIKRVSNKGMAKAASSNGQWPLMIVGGETGVIDNGGADV